MFGEQVRGLGCADPLEYLHCLPQQDPGLRGVAGGQGAAAQAGQCVCLVPGAGNSAGQVQGLLVKSLGLRQVTADPVQRPVSLSVSASPPRLPISRSMPRDSSNSSAAAG